MACPDSEGRDVDDAESEVDGMGGVKDRLDVDDEEDDDDEEEALEVEAEAKDEDDMLLIP